MAKINLNPGADASLVTAATRAGLATAPSNYSKAFESVSRSYEKTMEAQGQMWGDIGRVAAVVGADMVKNANELIDYRIKAGGLNPDSYKFLVNEIESNKQAQKDLGLLPGILGDKETRQTKRELKLKQAELFAEIDMAVDSINKGAEAIAAGTYDATLFTGDGELINAIIKSNLKDTITDAGNQAVLSRNEKTEELMFTLLDKDGNAFEPPRTMTMKEFNKSIATNVKDVNNVLGGSFSTIENEMATLGQNSKSSVISDQMLQLSLNRIDGMLQSDVDIKRAMLAKYGYSGTSFGDDLMSKNAMSENTFSSLVQIMEKDKSGQLKATGALEGIDDTDGIMGLSQKEINAGYATYAANILSMKDPAVSKAVFKESFANRIREAHKFGHSNRRTEGEGNQLNPFNKGAGTTVPGSAPEGSTKERYLSGAARNLNRRSVINIVNGVGGATRFVGILNDYNWDKDKGLWNDGEKDITTLDLMLNEQIHFSGGKFEKGLAGSGGGSGGQLKPEEITRIDNIWSDKMKEKKSAKALNDILKSYGITDTQVYEDDGMSAYGLMFKSEKLNIKTPGDKQRLIDLINRELSRVRQTPTATTDKADELLNKYGNNSN